LVVACRGPASRAGTGLRLVRSRSRTRSRRRGGFGARDLGRSPSVRCCVFSADRRVSLRRGRRLFSLPSVGGPVRRGGSGGGRPNRISCPYISTRLGRRSQTRAQLLQVRWLDEQQFFQRRIVQTTNAETLLYPSRAFRRHSRKYSFNSRSTEEVSGPN